MICAKRVRLRAVERSDLPKFHEWLNDPEVTEGLSVYLPLSMTDEEKWFDKSMEAEAAQRQLAIEIQKGQVWELIGSTGLFNLEWTNRCAEWGIFIGDRTCWDKGYGTESLQLMLEHGFNTLNLNRMYLRVYSTNARAQRSYQKAGFDMEGTLREGVYRRGRYIDVHIMSVLRSEWGASQEKS